MVFLSLRSISTLKKLLERERKKMTCHSLTGLLRSFFTYSPSSAAVARSYATTAHRPPEQRKLFTPLRLAYYAYVLVLAGRLTLNSLLGGAYNQYDLLMFLLDRLASNHLVGLVGAPYTLLAITFDYRLAGWPHPLVAPMLTDLLRSDGREKGSEKERKAKKPKKLTS